MIRPPHYDRRLEQGLIPVWRNGTSAVFRIDHSRRAAALLPTDLYGPAGKRIKRPARDS